MTIQDDFNSRTIHTVKQAQEIALETIKVVSERVQPLLPKLDGVPYIERLPKASDVVEKAFELSEELFKSAKKVALEATQSFSLRETKVAAKPVAKKATTTTTAAAS